MSRPEPLLDLGQEVSLTETGAGSEEQDPAPRRIHGGGQQALHPGGGGSIHRGGVRGDRLSQGIEERLERDLIYHWGRIGCADLVCSSVRSQGKKGKGRQLASIPRASVAKGFIKVWKRPLEKP